MLGYIYSALLILLPTAVLAFFIISLCKYIGAKRANKLKPDSFTDLQIKQRQLALIISGAIFGVMLAVVIGFTAIIALSIAYM